MTAPQAFSYRFGQTWLHQLDVRCKFILLCLFSLGTLMAHGISISIGIGLLFWLARTVRFPTWTTFHETRLFLVLILLIIVSRAFSVPGNILYTGFGLKITTEGILSGSLLAGRLFILLLAGMIFSFTTSPKEIKHAVQWLLKPMPMVPEKRVGVMVSLAFGFIPVILGQYHEIRDAQNARCADLSRNPFKRIIRIGIPLFRKIFQSADRLVMAMEARSFQEDRTDPQFSSSGKETIAFAAGICLFCIIILV